VTVVERLCAPTCDVLLARASSGSRDHDVVSARLRSQLAARLADSLGADRRRHRLDAFAAELGPARFDAPFAWSARAARRPIGTSVARDVAVGAMPDALSAAASEIERLCDRAHRGLTRRGALGAWLAAAPSATRALCAVEASTWAERLVRLVEPTHDGSVAVGIPDAWFEVPGTTITLQGRLDAALRPAEGAHLGLLRVRDGLPGARAADGLVVDALVAALAGRCPTRMLGAWPDAGLCLVVDFDDEAARRAARLLLACADALAAPSAAPSPLEAVAA
jgi:hypothetical protein